MANDVQLSAHSESHTLSTASGLKLQAAIYKPDGDARALVIITHGIGEHCGRYAHVIEYLTSQGHAVATMDLRGHGRSEGDRVLVDTFSDYADDVAGLIDLARSQFPNIPMFMMGHSMGGTITLYYAVTRQHEAQGLIVSGAAIELGSDVPAILQRIAHLAGRIVPKLPMLKLSSAGLSKDESVSSAYDADPLVYHGGIPARTGSQMIIAIERILDNLDLLTMPMLILHGEMDPLVAESGSRDLYASVPTTDKTLQVYPGLYHEILNEPERKQVLEEIGSWLEIHLNG